MTSWNSQRGKSMKKYYSSGPDCKRAHRHRIRSNGQNRFEPHLQADVSCKLRIRIRLVLLTTATTRRRHCSRLRSPSSIGV
uniref:Uncharacterized protein n=1 Tax=Oryza punctata TaxID=4537 RepID=A0A0E0LGL4_ORYPU